MNFTMKPVAYRLVTNLAVEHFGDKALILVAHRDAFLTVNTAAASLLKLTRDTFAGGAFSNKDMASLLLQNYRLTEAKALDMAQGIIDSWLEHEVLIARYENGGRS